MKTKAISNQNFNGRIMYENRRFLNGYVDKLSEYMPQKLGKNIETHISDMIANKPYDLFIFRNRKQPEFIEVAANTSLSNIIGKNLRVAPRQILVHECMPADTYIEAAKDAINGYEEVYKNLPKQKQKDNFMTKIINKIKNI